MAAVVYAIYALYFWACSLYSVIAPFFPHVAKEKGMPEDQVGLMFSLYAIVAILFSPISGKVMMWIGRKYFILIGTAIETVGILLFGFANYYDESSFVIFSFVARLLQGIGGSALTVTLFAIIANAFPNDMESKLGWMETCGGIGLIVGPLIGGLFYSIGGYEFTFIVYVVILIILTLVTYFILPAPKKDHENGKQVEKKQISLLKLAFNKKVFPTLLVVMFGMAGPSYLEPVLAAHLKSDYDLSLETIAIIFALPVIGYTAAVKYQSKMPNKIDRKVILLVGLFIEGIAFFFVGPAFGIVKELAIVAFGLILIGLGGALAYLPSLPYMIDAAAKELKIEDREHLSDCMSTVMGTFHYVGEAFGPISAGLLTQNLNFEDGAAIFGGLILLYALIYGLITKGLVKLFKCKFTKKEKVKIDLKQRLLAEDRNLN